MPARIFKPAKTAMQSGTGRSDEWVVKLEASTSREIDPLMGYTSSRDTNAQLDLAFATREAAIAYCEKNGIAFTVSEPQARKPVRKSYSENFKYGRIGSWTH